MQRINTDTFKNPKELTSAPVPPWAMKVILDETFVLEEEPL